MTLRLTELCTPEELAKIVTRSADILDVPIKVVRSGDGAPQPGNFPDWPTGCCAGYGTLPRSGRGAIVTSVADAAPR